MIRYLEALRSWMWGINNYMNRFRESNNISLTTGMGIEGLNN